MSGKTNGQGQAKRISSDRKREETRGYLREIEEKGHPFRKKREQNGEVHGLFVVKARYRVGAATGAEAEELVRDFVGDKGKVSVYYRLGEGPLARGMVAAD